MAACAWNGVAAKMSSRAVNTAVSLLFKMIEPPISLKKIPVERNNPFQQAPLINTVEWMENQVGVSI